MCLVIDKKKIVHSDLRNVVFLKASEDFERIRLLCYRDTGCLAICNIYSGHVFNEDEFSTLANEIEGIRSEAETVLIAGDFNTHQRSWFKISTSDTPKGNALRFLAETQGLRQLVDFPLAAQMHWIWF